jgi:hypothetical protein
MKIEHGYDPPRRVLTIRAWLYCCWWFTYPRPSRIQLVLRLCGCYLTLTWRAGS